MAEVNENKRALIGAALAELVATARSGGPRNRVGLMAAGSELPVEEFLLGAATAMRRDSRLQVVGLGPRPEAALPEGMDWIETPDCEADIAAAMEKALDSGDLEGAVALHYPFPVGVTTMGRVFTPARGKPMILASSTGISAPQRACAMLRNAVYGLAAAKAMGIAEPTLGVLNLDAAPQVMRALSRMAEKGYALRFGQSVRKDGGALLRGNDILAGAVDVCVCDTLTGNVLAKVFAAFGTGGGYEAAGWGYGPSTGEGWNKVVSIISRASGAPVIANALSYTAQALRGGLPAKVAAELRAARAAGLDAELEGLLPKAEAGAGDTPAMPPVVPTDEEIHGIDVLDLENAVHVLWKEGIYAEGAMGCTGPVVKLASSSLEKAKGLLQSAGYL
ncbi:MAG: glycine reductase [Desulfovibrio sp.]|uniref:glycine/sarcosine/betaine reductase complex component C subunit alpha n=1 Tax=Desulfovibrio TaxID=872 RepID=UPI00258D6D73|nr:MULTISPECIES: glycine/sarcosine/betaine reductase complex component C subunit alpha [Desulfovibrio]MCD7983787.1 glycine reductase [Desulfovibrio sp.]MDY3810707.1 glycine/sarcosine/betaine reductase complex component C subunit alpha [Desulfovibrio porci]